MPFVPLVLGRGLHYQPQPIVRFYHSFKTRQNRQVRVIVGRPVVEQMGWQANDRILVSFGVGDDLGRVQLMKVRTGGQKLFGNALNKSNSYQVCVTIPKEGFGGFTGAEFLEMLPSSSLCEYQTARDGLLVTIPEVRAMLGANLRVVA